MVTFNPEALSVITADEGLLITITVSGCALSAAVAAQAHEAIISEVRICFIVV